MKKKAILVVSFGTSYIENIDKTIGNIENTIADKYKDYDIFRAFTSGIIISKLRKSGYEIKSVKEKLEEILYLGYEECYIQPTHIIAGREYDKVKEFYKEFYGKFKVLKLGMPLLSSEKDIYLTAEALYKNMIFEMDEAVVLMGHGSDHLSNKLYKELESSFRKKGYNNFFVGTVEASPNVNEVFNAVKESLFKKAVMFPFLVVAGEHALNDMSGKEEISWVNIFSNEGIESRAVIKGIGEYKEIADLYCSHIKKYMGI